MRNSRQNPSNIPITPTRLPRSYNRRRRCLKTGDLLGDSQPASSSWKPLKASVLRRMFRCFTVTSVVALRFCESGNKNFGRLQEYFTAYMTSQREVIQRLAAAKDIHNTCQLRICWATCLYNLFLQTSISTMKIFSISVVLAPSGSPGTILSTASDVSSFSFYQRGSINEFLTFFTKTVVDRTAQGQRQSVQENNHTAHVFNRGGAEQLAGQSAAFSRPPWFTLSYSCHNNRPRVPRSARILSLDQDFG